MIAGEYTHRNGETDTPTEPGLYWFRGSKWGKAAQGMGNRAWCCIR